VPRNQDSAKFVGRTPDDGFVMDPIKGATPEQEIPLDARDSGSIYQVSKKCLRRNEISCFDYRQQLIFQLKPPSFGLVYRPSLKSWSSDGVYRLSAPHKSHAAPMLAI